MTAKPAKAAREPGSGSAARCRPLSYFAIHSVFAAFASFAVGSVVASFAVHLVEKSPQRAKRLAAMADRRLLGSCHFCQRALVRRVEEDGVVAKSAGSARLRRDGAFESRGSLEEHPLAGDERDGAHKPSRAA